MNQNYSGGSLKLAGQGWKRNIGTTLIALGTLGGLGNLDTQPVEGLLGGAVLAGLGGLLVHLDKKKGSGMGRQCGSGNILNTKIISHFKKLLSKRQQGGAYSKQKIQDIINQHKHKKIHIKDVFGAQWKEKGQQLLNALKQARKLQKGGDIFSDIGKVAKKVGKSVKKVGKKVYKSTKKLRDAGYKKMVQFVNGKTKFKPSQLLSYASATVGIAGAISGLIPGVDIISVPLASASALGLKSASLALKTSGRGIIPKRYLNWAQKNPDKAKHVLDYLKKQKGRGILKKALVGIVGLSLYGFLKENPQAIRQIGNLISQKMGGGINPIKKMPKKAQTFFNKYPIISKKLANLAKKGSGQSGSGKLTSLLASAGLVTASASIGAYALYEYLLQNPSVATKIAVKGAVKLLGSGLSLSGGKLPRGCQMLPNGKIKCDKYSVWNNIHPKTRGNLTKKDLMQKGNKIISIKKHAQGIAMMKRGGGIYS